MGTFPSVAVAGRIVGLGDLSILPIHRDADSTTVRRPFDAVEVYPAILVRSPPQEAVQDPIEIHPIDSAFAIGERSPCRLHLVIARLGSASRRHHGSVAVRQWYGGQVQRATRTLSPFMVSPPEDQGAPIAYSAAVSNRSACDLDDPVGGPFSATIRHRPGIYSVDPGEPVCPSLCMPQHIRVAAAFRAGGDSFHLRSHDHGDDGKYCCRHCRPTRPPPERPVTAFLPPALFHKRRQIRILPESPWEWYS